MSNMIHLIGNVATVITRDDYTRADGEVLTKIRFLLATDKDMPPRADGTKRPADYIPVEVWGGIARAVAEYQGRGSKLAITGRLKSEFWRPEGAEKDKLDITVVADRVEFLGPRRSEEKDSDGVTTEPATTDAAAEVSDTRATPRPAAGGRR